MESARSMVKRMGIEQGTLDGQPHHASKKLGEQVIANANHG